LGCTRWDAHWRHLVNTTEPSVWRTTCFCRAKKKMFSKLKRRLLALVITHQITSRIKRSACQLR